MPSESTIRELIFELQLAIQDLRGRVERIDEGQSRSDVDAGRIQESLERLRIMAYKIEQIELQIAAGQENRRDLWMEALKTLIGGAVGAALVWFINGLSS